MRLIILSLSFLFFFCQKPASQDMENKSSSREDEVTEEKQITPGAHRLNEYLPLLKDKRIALTVNQTSTVGASHFVDTLVSLGVDVVKVFAPEHGFRGTADAGEYVKNSIDQKTGVPIVSLYGNNKKPTAEQLKDVDIIVFDIQDVGVRFYTYISTMHYLMEAAAENGKEILILDRPNPHGMYVDGPVLEKGYESFVGMHPIPLVHGLTVGELAKMINSEGWLKDKRKADLKVIKVENYDHSMNYYLPIQPSPNLPNDKSIALYPSLGLFEGTVISVGRGTDAPFQQIGHPELKSYDYSFVPQSTEGAKNPPLKGQKVFGLNLQDEKLDYKFTLRYLIDMYKAFPEKEKFFNNFFEKLAGNGDLRDMITSGVPEERIRASWNPALENYKQIREKYLLYPDSKN